MREVCFNIWREVNVQEIGAINAILSSIKTRVDGSVTLSFEVNPSEIEVINRLMQCYLLNHKLFTMALIKVDE
jgi:hypothetical protein